MVNISNGNSTRINCESEFTQLQQLKTQVILGECLLLKKIPLLILAFFHCDVLLSNLVCVMCMFLADLKLVTNVLCFYRLLAVAGQQEVGVAVVTKLQI